MMKSENGEHCFGVQYQHSGAPVYVCTLYCVHAVLTGQVCLEDVYIDIHIRRSSIQLRHSAFNMSTLVCMASHVTDMFHHSTESPCTYIHTYISPCSTATISMLLCKVMWYIVSH